MSTSTVRHVVDTTVLIIAYYNKLFKKTIENIGLSPIKNVVSWRTDDWGKGKCNVEMMNDE